MFNWLKRSMLMKNILSSSGIVLVVVLVTSLVSYQYSSKILKDAIEKELMAVLATTIINIESREDIFISELAMLTNEQTLKIYDEVPEGNIRKIFRDYKTHNEGLIEGIFIIDPEGKVFIDSENKRLMELQFADNPGFMDAMSGISSWTDVSPSILDASDLIIGMVPIYDSEGTIHGVLATSVYFDLFRDILGGVSIGDAGYAYALNSDKIIVAHPKTELIDTDITALGIEQLNLATEKMVSGVSGVVEYRYDGVGKINYYDSVGRLSISVNASDEDYLSPLKSLAKIQMIIGVTFFLLGTLIAVINVVVMVRKIKRIKNAMALVTEGDLTAGVQFKKGDELDEVGQIGIGMNMMVESVKNMINHIKESSESLAAASQQLSASADQNRMASEETANSMQEIAVGAERQVDVITETTALFNVVNHQMISSSDVAKSMVEKSEEVKGAATMGKTVIHSSKVTMDKVKDLSENTVRAIEALNEKSDQIGEINGMISQIAEQTNLLALNAAIEAARAGEQGKGFAVVADEIRKLAAQSQLSARGIQGLIVEMQEKVKDASQLIQEENRQVDEGISSVEGSEKAFGMINDNIVNVVEQIDQVVKSIHETIESTNMVNSAIQEVVSIVHETSASSEAIAASSEEQMAVSEEISSSATQLAQMAEDLLRAVISFKTE